MGTIHEFGDFRLDRDAGILFHRDRPSCLGQRAVALLVLLVERAGQPVSKDALIEAAWRGLAVEESNLSVQIAALRRVLDEGGGSAAWIETLPRRGYRYVGPEVVASFTRVNEPSSVTTALSLPDKPSIAVLPFSVLSDDAEQQYFADGMVEDIIAGLSRIKWLFVVARNSSLTYRDKALDARLAGRELGVRYILRGSLRKGRDRLRVSAQMVEADTGEQLWADRYDRPLDDIFALQDEIALSVVGTIEPSLRRAEVERVKRKRPESLDAYDLVLRAQPDVYSGMPDRVTQALTLLERALALDPTYPLAHGFAAMCHHCLFLRAGLREDSREASILHARSAIAHGQDDAHALTFAGFSIGMDGHDHAAAFTALDAALAISPSSAITYIIGGVMLGWAGKAERAIEWGNHALRLSPFDPWAWSAFHALALGHFHRGNDEDAANAAYKAVQFNPAHSISHMLLVAPLARLGRLDEARAAAKRVVELQPEFRYRRQFAGVNCAPALAASLGEALEQAGLPS